MLPISRNPAWRTACSEGAFSACTAGVDRLISLLLQPHTGEHEYISEEPPIPASREYIAVIQLGFAFVQAKQPAGMFMMVYPDQAGQLSSDEGHCTRINTVTPSTTPLSAAATSSQREDRSMAGTGSYAITSERDKSARKWFRLGWNTAGRNG